MAGLDCRPPTLTLPLEGTFAEWVTSPFEARLRSHLRVRSPKQNRLILRCPPQAGLEGGAVSQRSLKGGGEHEAHYQSSPSPLRGEGRGGGGADTGGSYG